MSIWTSHDQVKLSESVVVDVATTNLHHIAYPAIRVLSIGSDDVHLVLGGEQAYDLANLILDALKWANSVYD